MGQLSSKLRNVEGDRLAFWCPGCNESHVVAVAADGGRPTWKWNGDADKPSFQPSILIRGTQTVRDESGKWLGGWKYDEAGKPLPLVCHSFVTDGRIQFLGDCTHALAGQTVDLPDWTD